MNNYVSPDRRLTLSACKKILNTDGLNYTDEEIIKIRDWLYVMADIAIDAIDKNAVLSEKDKEYLINRGYNVAENGKVIKSKGKKGNNH